MPFNLRIVIGLALMGSIASQLYGPNNCGNGNNNYCGTTIYNDLCTPEATQAAYNNFMQYISNIGNPANNYAASTAFTTGNGNADGTIPPFQFNWYGSSSLIPIAGSYTGSMALANFFGVVNSDVIDFTFYSYIYLPCGGVLIPAYNCQFLIAQWQEMSKVIDTGKSITYATNTVRYTFLNSTYPYIAVADVFVNDGQYQDAFCPGQVNCDGYTSNDDDNMDDKYTAILAVVVIILIIQVLVSVFLVWRLSSNKSSMSKWSLNFQSHEIKRCPRCTSRLTRRSIFSFAI